MIPFHPPVTLTKDLEFVDSHGIVIVPSILYRNDAKHLSTQTEVAHWLMDAIEEKLNRGLTDSVTSVTFVTEPVTSVAEDNGKSVVQEKKRRGNPNFVKGHVPHNKKVTTHAG